MTGDMLITCDRSEGYIYAGFFFKSGELATPYSLNLMGNTLTGFIINFLINAP